VVRRRSHSSEDSSTSGLHNSSSEQLDVPHTPVEIEVPKELSKNADVVSATVFHVNNNKCLVHDNLEIERLEQENYHLFELLLSQDIVHICVNSLATRNNCREMQQSFIHKYNENLVFKAELANKKEHMIEKKFFYEVVLRCSQLENWCANHELKLQHQKESFLNNKPLINKDAPEILEFFKINEWQAKLNAKDVSIAKLKKHIESLKGKNVVEKDLRMSHRIRPRLLLQEFKHARAVRPLDSDLDSACKYAKRIQDVLVYVKATCPSLTKPNEKLVAITPLNKNKKVRFAEPATRVIPSTSASGSQSKNNTRKNRITPAASSNKKNKTVEAHPRKVMSSSNKKNHVSLCNANFKHAVKDANSKFVCSTCNGCLFFANHDKCVVTYINYVNKRAKSKSGKSKKME
ncbi:hypothetical protein Tco_1548164, partial [Tanacetum coccineum]